MPASTAISLTSPTTVVAGVTPRIAQRLSAIGIRCVADLVRHLPLRHEHEHAEATIAEAGRAVGPRHHAEANVAVRGQIVAARVVRGRTVRVEATLTDGTATMKLTWFNAPWVKNHIHPGAAVIVEGTAKRHGDWLEMVNPRMRPAEAPAATEGAGAGAGPRRDERHRPVYPASEALSSESIERVVTAALPLALPLIEDHLSAAFRERRGLPALADAYRMIHAPRSPDEALAARRRLAYDDLLMLQLGVMMRRRELRENMRAPVLRSSPAIDAAILRRIPFTLTPDQRSVVDEIAADCGRETPMNRLLQGDVGSGKTVVALYAMLLAVAARHQAAIMAPTELLAEQHHASIGRLLEGSQVRLALVTADQSKRERETLLAQLADGTIDLVVGTHAVLTERVRFASLALAVIDEQHRFGVHQRATLRTKGPVAGARRPRRPARNRSSRICSS
ncbi:MAG: DEAD/DEAH box helicase [Phycisphaerales bacterium]